MMKSIIVSRALGREVRVIDFDAQLNLPTNVIGWK